MISAMILGACRPWCVGRGDFGVRVFGVDLIPAAAEGLIQLHERDQFVALRLR
jgi:hypothetical protein